MKKIVLGFGLLVAGISFGQKKVTCTHTDVLGETTTVNYEIKGEIVHEADVEVNASLKDYYYAHWDGATMYFTKYTVNKKDNTCWSIYADRINKDQVNWNMGNPFESNSKEIKNADGTVEINLGGNAFTKVAKEKVIIPFYKKNYEANASTADCLFKDEATYKAFFQKVVK